MDTEKTCCCGGAPTEPEPAATFPLEGATLPEPGCCCSGKLTRRSEEERKKLVNRLSRIEGQIRGLRGMVERDAYCADILTQSAAAGAALNAFNRDLIASHIKGCVARDIRNGDDTVIDELVVTLQKLMR